MLNLGIASQGIRKRKFANAQMIGRKKEKCENERNCFARIRLRLSASALP
jgi:hypothetical protein